MFYFDKMHNKQEEVINNLMLNDIVFQARTVANKLNSELEGMFYLKGKFCKLICRLLTS